MTNAEFSHADMMSLILEAQDELIKDGIDKLLTDINLHKLIQDGSLDAKSYSIMVDTSLDPLKLELVLRHELMHADLAQRHYGEAIRRLKSLSIMMFIPLCILRSKIIEDAYKSTFNSTRESDPISFFERVTSDKSFRIIIRDLLYSHRVFMECLKMIKSIELKRELLEKHWTTVQEGAANFWSLINLVHKHEGDNEVAHLYEVTTSRLIREKSPAGDGFRKMLFLCQKWGPDWLYPVQIACVHPDMTRFSLLEISLEDLEKELKSARLSPDVRLNEVCMFAEREDYYPSGDNFIELYKKLDPDNPRALSSIAQFNEYWLSIDGNSTYVNLMNKLLEQLKLTTPFRPPQVRTRKNLIDRGRYKVEHIYPISQVDSVILRVFRSLGIKDTFKFDKKKVKLFEKKQPIAVIIKNKSGEVLYDFKSGKARSDLSDSMEIFLKTMEIEGIIQ